MPDAKKTCKKAVIEMQDYSPEDNKNPMSNIKGIRYGVSGLSKAVARIALPVMAKRKTYQDVHLGGRRISRGGRACGERWEAVRVVIEQTGAKSLTDLGCAEGYFVRKAVEIGLFGLGVDADASKIVWCSTLALDGLSGCGFVKMTMDNDTVDRLPAADITVALSFAHHIMYDKGVDYTREFLSKVREKTNKALIIEMGQSNESHHAWASMLPDMGDDPHAWIANFVKSAGFSSVSAICKTESQKSGTERMTFAAYV